MTRILLIQGPNMAYLGRREPEIYGTTTAAELDALLEAHAESHGYALEIMYTHVEGEAIARIYEAVDDSTDVLVMNPAGMTYAGYAVRDCLKAVAPDLPYIEVHMAILEKRGMRSVPGQTLRRSLPSTPWHSNNSPAQVVSDSVLPSEVRKSSLLSLRSER